MCAKGDLLPVRTYVSTPGTAPTATIRPTSITTFLNIFTLFIG